MTKTTGLTSGYHTHNPTMSETTHDIMNFPHSYDESRIQEVHFDSKVYKAGQTKQQSAFTTFPNCKEFASALCEMCVMEGNLEKKRRELALRQDFNLCDVYKMFLRLAINKPGVDCHDVYYTLKSNLEIDITMDEVFIIFYKVDKDSDGFWSFNEMQEAFVPREKQYASLVTTRGGFYGSEPDVRQYFEPQTREALKRFLR
jgi:hypothetical protein